MAGARRLRGMGSTATLAAAIASATLLTGAAVYTVEAGGCGESAQYVRHDDHTELVGGCVDGASLPPAAPRAAADGMTPQENYRP